MLKKNASLLLVAALVCTLCGSSTFAQTPAAPDVKSNKVTEVSDSGLAGKKEATSHESLKADIQKLVAAAKAGKGLSVSDPQNQPAQSNSLSKRTKIIIGVSVAAVIVITIIAIHISNHLFD